MPKTVTVRCVSAHHEDLADGRTVEPGGRAERVDIDAPHNARLLEEGRIFVEPDAPKRRKPAPDPVPDEEVSE